MTTYPNAAGELCVSLREAAKVLGVSPEAVRKAIATGRLPGSRVPEGYNLVLVPLAALRVRRRRPKRFRLRRS